jgi:hypothetical protein
VQRQTIRSKYSEEGVPSPVYIYISSKRRRKTSLGGWSLLAGTQLVQVEYLVRRGHRFEDPANPKSRVLPAVLSQRGVDAFKESDESTGVRQ